MFDSIAILSEIRKIRLFDGARYNCAYVSPDGDWTVGPADCKPANTWRISQYDLDVCSDSELIELLKGFHLRYSV